MACRDFRYGLEDADLSERLCKGAMLNLLHELASSLVFFEVSKSYNKPILRRASCGNKTTIVTSRDLVILVGLPVD